MERWVTDVRKGKGWRGWEDPFEGVAFLGGQEEEEGESDEQSQRQREEESSSGEEENRHEEGLPEVTVQNEGERGQILAEREPPVWLRKDWQWEQKFGAGCFLIIRHEGKGDMVDLLEGGMERFAEESRLSSFLGWSEQQGGERTMMIDIGMVKPKEEGPGEGPKCKIILQKLPRKEEIDAMNAEERAELMKALLDEALQGVNKRRHEVIEFRQLVKADHLYKTMRRNEEGMPWEGARKRPEGLSATAAELLAGLKGVCIGIKQLVADE